MAWSLDADDIELKKSKTTSFLGICIPTLGIVDNPANSMREAAIHDVFAQEFEPRAGVPYYHFSPALVATNAGNNNDVGFLLYPLFKIASFIGITPTQWAPVPVFVVLNRPSYTTVSKKGTEVSVKPALREPELRNKVMAFFKDATGVELGRS
jgi:hypothetical protein